MTVRFNAKGATAAPVGGTNLVTAGVGAADDTLTSITQVLNVGLAQNNTWTAATQIISVSVNGAVQLQVNNANAGAGAQATVSISADVASCQFGVFSSTFGTTLLATAFGIFTQPGTTGGIVIATRDAAAIRFNINGLTTAQTAVTIDSTGQLVCNLAGKGLSIKTGGNCKMGTGTLSSGTVVISTTAVTASSFIFLTDTSAGIVNVGALTVSAISAGASFTVKSTNVADSGTFNWLIIEPS